MPAPVSVTLIVKNEVHNLRDCLTPLLDLAAEIIVVDTGSTDGTRELAEELGVRVVDFTWCDDFAAARNEGLRHAQNPWIFWIDADERIDAEQKPRLAALFASLQNETENIAYLMKCVSTRAQAQGSYTVTDYLRIFRNDPRIRWEHRIHEQIRAAVERAGGTLKWSDVIIKHFGYQDPVAMRGKAERNLRLLLLQDQETPSQPFVLFNIGRCYKVLENMPEAIGYWHRALALSSPQSYFLKQLYALLIDGHDSLRQTELALALSIEGGRHFPQSIELLFREGMLRVESGDFARAEACLREVLNRKLPWDIQLEEPHLRSKCWHNLAVLYLRQGRIAEGEQILRQSLAENPNYLLAWQVLAQIAINQGRWQEANEAIQQLERDPQLVPLAAPLKARLQASQK